jgi:hypothetical protein
MAMNQNRIDTMKTADQLPIFFSAHLEAALWSSTDDDSESLDSKFSPEDIEPETPEVLKAHCLSFLSRALPFIENEERDGNKIEMAGHDFWLTSQGHGAGFWDGDWPKYGDLLTKLSECYPSEIKLEPNEEGRLVA